MHVGNRNTFASPKFYVQGTSVDSYTNCKLNGATDSAISGSFTLYNADNYINCVNTEYGFHLWMKRWGDSAGEKQWEVQVFKLPSPSKLPPVASDNFPKVNQWYNWMKDIPNNTLVSDMSIPGWFHQ